MRGRTAVVAVFNNNFEAELARDRLEEEGIAADLEDDAIGEGGFSVVELHVPRKDLARARRVLASLTEEPAHSGIDGRGRPAGGDGDGWTLCSGCGSEVSTLFPACPACGVEVEAREEAARYAAPRPGRRGAGDDYERLSLNDDLAERAWLTAVFGCVTLPVVLHVYSFWLLLRLLVTPGEVSPRRWPKACAALFIDTVIFTVAVLVCKGLLA